MFGVDRLEAAPVVGGAVATGDLSEEDRRLGGLALAEEDGVVAMRPRSPMRQQLAGVGGDAVPVACPPALDLAADVVDQRVLLEALPRCIEVERRLFARALGRPRDRDERLARPPPFLDLPGRPALAEREVALGWLERRVQNRVRKVGFSHSLSPFSSWVVPPGAILTGGGRRYPRRWRGLCSAHLWISLRSQSRGRPRPRSSTGRGMSG